MINVTFSHTNPFFFNEFGTSVLSPVQILICNFWNTREWILFNRKIGEKLYVFVGTDKHNFDEKSVTFTAMFSVTNHEIFKGGRRASHLGVLLIGSKTMVWMGLLHMHMRITVKPSLTHTVVLKLHECKMHKAGTFCFLFRFSCWLKVRDCTVVCYRCEIINDIFFLLRATISIKKRDFILNIDGLTSWYRYVDRRVFYNMNWIWPMI